MATGTRRLLETLRAWIRCRVHAARQCRLGLRVTAHGGDVFETVPWSKRIEEGGVCRTLDEETFPRGRMWKRGEDRPKSLPGNEEFRLPTIFDPPDTKGIELLTH